MYTHTHTQLPLWTVTSDADDPRRLYQRISDDIAALILDGTLGPNAMLPSARDLAETYGVSVMTAQRAMHELRQYRFTYAINGKGTYVHPDARNVAALLHAMRQPRLARDLAWYLQFQADLAWTQAATGTPAQQASLACLLLEHAADSQPLLEYLRQLWPEPPDPPA